MTSLSPRSSGRTPRRAVRLARALLAGATLLLLPATVAVHAAVPARSPVAAVAALAPDVPATEVRLVEAVPHEDYLVDVAEPLALTTSLGNSHFDIAGLRGSAREYKFIATHSGRPARWNPCAPISYRINPGGMSGADVGEVKAAFARLGAASGLRFVYVGTTSYVWSKNKRNGSAPRDAAMTFSFARAGNARGQSDYLGNARVVGIGGPSWRDDGRTMRIVSGAVVINSSIVTRLARGTGKGSRMNAYLHEIGHAVGLDHTTGRAQLMYPTLQLGLPPTFGAGDTAGLKQVGRPAGCLTRP